MKIQIKSIFGAVLFETEAESLRDAVIAAVEAGADLSYADLSRADLSYANLSYANLPHADLSYANLSNADLSHANLFHANLFHADLSNANLFHANLFHANLSDANLSHAILSDANLSHANLPSPATILQASWGLVSDQLTADLMELDAFNHPDRAAFDRWAAGGVCPYEGVKIQRMANFKENRALWGKGKLDSCYNLMTRLFAEKGIKR